MNRLKPEEVAIPYAIVECTGNLGDDARIPELLQVMNETLVAQSSTFPTDDIRSRAIKLTECRVVDGREDDAFVHVMFRVVGGRTLEVRKAAYDALFEAIKVYFAQAFTCCYPALSIESTEFDEGGSYKHGNIHVRFRRA